MANKRNGEERNLPAPAQPMQVQVFGTDNPEKVLERAGRVAKALAPIIEAQKLYRLIGTKKHVYCEGWTSMAAMLGVFPYTEYAKKLERDGETAYEARVILRHISGAEIASGEAICSSKERNWFNRDEFAIKSMAQTRAVGKACRLAFSWIMTLAGYAPTPEEETLTEERNHVQAEAPEVVQTQTKANGKAIDEKTRRFFWAKIKELGVPEVSLRELVVQVRGKESTAGMTDEEMRKILDLAVAKAK